MKALFAWLARVRRWPIQLASAIAMNSYFFADTLKAIPCWGLNCYACPAAVFSCPIGALQHFAITRQIPFYVLGILGIAGALGGRWSCGWFCPFGFIQDLAYKLNTPKLSIKTGRLGWLRYAILIVLVFAIPYVTLEPWFSKLCPMGMLEGGIPQILLRPELRPQIGWFYWLKLAILLTTFIAMLTIKRPFCRLICPLGAIWSPFNKVSAVSLQVDHHTCTQCGRCKQVCPVDISVYDAPNTDACIRCLACVNACPHDAVHIE